MNNYTYLALGDSYTIGEQVILTDSFPYQVVQRLRTALPAGKGNNILAPEIIAKTGWTTDELLLAIEKYSFLPRYDYVSLLIGVNNQYRGRAVEEFSKEFEQLLKLALNFAGNDSEKLFVLSIPDWGLTPFAKERDQKQISADIDAYNSSCKKITETHSCSFIDITASQRVDVNDPDFLAADGLHPSGKEYSKWASKLSEAILLTIPRQ